MKKLLSVLFCVLVFCSVFAVTASAQEGEKVLISRTVEYLEDGSYYVDEVYETNPMLRSTKSGSKASYYVSGSGTTIYSVIVTGTFSYNGSTSSATNSTATVRIYVPNATPNGKSAYTSGSTAYATGSVICEGITLRRTVSISCDKNGNLS